MRRLKTGPLILICIVIGSGLGALMITTKFGPGIIPYPPANTASYRNSLRQGDIDQLTTAFQQYYKAYHSLPITLTSSPQQICTSTGSNCASVHMIDVSFLVTGGLYVQGVPHDPNLKGLPLWASGFYIASLSANTVRISDPDAELGRTIQSTFKL